jgi:hypothetical protein
MNDKIKVVEEKDESAILFKGVKLITTDFHIVGRAIKNTKDIAYPRLAKEVVDNG